MPKNIKKMRSHEDNDIWQEIKHHELTKHHRDEKLQKVREDIKLFDDFENKEI